MKIRIIIILILSSFLNSQDVSVEKNYKLIVDGYKHSFLKYPGNTFFISGSIGALAFYKYDNKIQNWFSKNKILPGQINKFADNYGNKYSLLVVLATTGLHSLKSQFRSEFEYAFITLACNGFSTIILKEMIGRQRPNGKDHRSFPSGHVSHSFTSATVLNEVFGWRYGTGAYALAVLVAINRMQDNKHYLSDVIFSSGLGTAFGLGFSNLYFKKDRKLKISIYPSKMEMTYLLNT